MPALLIRLIGPARTALLAEFLRFGTVGFAGFIVDNATVCLRGAIGSGGRARWPIARRPPQPGRQPDMVFRPPSERRPGMPGVVPGEYFGIPQPRHLFPDDRQPTARRCQPGARAFAGTLAGMLVNFHLSRTVVFR